ncbi:FMN-binding protein [Pseudosporangium ferrugineum]|uniref:FMN-binding protein n=1 Tax=Pseudosporangium ferrugineum TaxID=439699 RepID=A0A2T0RNX4_9ACTN|nr:FMN-binding protein [Pseudosporangium ferrugineum]PRY22894.1 FMN-binding protein [Pseudosporangium ferrugineum]
MRRSTAAAVGTLTGAALIVGVRLSVSAPAVPAAAPPAVDLAGSGQDAPPSKKPSGKKPSNSDSSDADADSSSEGAAGGTGLKNGIFKGTAVKNPYGTIQVSIRVEGGKITAADATYPTTADSATINPPAIASLKQSTVQSQSADVDAVSGATFTSESYVKSLQAAIDKANA